MAPLWGLIAILVVISNSLSPGVQAAQSTYLNFQARLLTNSGAVVSDGYYHVEFKLYNVASGGTAQWTETWSSGDNSNRIRVVNGYLTANLGADTAFSGTIAWDEQQWLTMNIGGTSGSASWDGEMNPRILLTALPYAFKSAETLAVKKVSGANIGTLNFNTVANNPAILLPDASGTVCLQGSSSCSFAPTTGGSGYIQNGTGVQTANYNIQSAATGSIAALISGASGQSVDILQVKADGVANPLLSIGNTGEATFQNSSDSTSAFQVQNQAGNNYLLVNTFGASVSVGNTGIASTVQIGNTTGAVAQTINIGNNATASSITALTLGSTVGTSATTIQAGTGNLNITTQGGSLNIGTNAVAQAITIGNSTGTTSVSVQCGTGNCGFGANSTDHTTNVGNVTGTSTLNLKGGTGGIIAQTGNVATAFTVQNASGVQLFTIDATADPTQKLANTSFEGNINGFSAYGTATVSHNTTQAYIGFNSMQVATPASVNQGTQYVSPGLTSSSTFTLTFYARLSAGTFTTMEVGRTENGSTEIPCLTNQTVVTGGWTRFTCTFTTGTVSGTNYLYIKQTDATARTFYIDGIKFEDGSIATPVRTAGTSIIGTQIQPSTFKNVTDSSTSFQIQNAAGTSNLLIANTLNSKIGIGMAPTTTGAILQVGGGIQLAAGNGIVSSNTQGLNFLNTAGTAKYNIGTAGTNNEYLYFSTRNAADSTRSDAFYILAASTAATNNAEVQFAHGIQQAGYDSRVTIVPGATGQKGLLIRGMASQTANLLLVEDSAQADLFKVGPTGDVVFQNSADSATAFQIQNVGGNNYLLVNTSGASVSLGDTGIASTIQIGNTTGAVAQTINIGNNATASSSTTLNIGSTIGASSLLLQAGTGALNIQTQSTGTINIGANAAAQTITIGNSTGATGVDINAGTGDIEIGTNAVGHTIAIGNSVSGTSVSVSCHTAGCYFGTNAVAHSTYIGSTTGASTLFLQGGTAGINIGNNGIANTIQIGNTTGAVAQTINIGNNTTASSSTTVNIGSTLGAVNLNGNTSVASGRTMSVQGGLTSLTANGAASGDALHVSNSTGGGNIAVFNDDGTAVLRVIDDGGTILSPLSTYTGSALTVTQAGNPTSGNALIKANNTHGTPSGNLLDLQTGGSSRFSVDMGGNLTLGQTGNANSTIRKNMNVSGAIVANDVVVLHSTAGTVTRTTTASDTKVFGIATGSGTPQDIVISGVYQVNLDSSTANVVIGDFIVTSTEAGMVTKSTNPATGSMLGRALSTTGAAGAGQKVWVSVAPGTGGSSDSLQTAYENSTTTEIVLNSTNNGLNIWDNISPITGNLFSVQSYNASDTYFGVSATGTSLLGTLSQTTGNLLAGATGYTQTLTNASTSGGTVNGMNQTITVSNTTSASTTQGLNINLSDATSLSNTNKGLNISLSGGNVNQSQVGIDVAANKGIGVRSVITGAAAGNLTCGPLVNSNTAICGASTSTSQGASGVIGVVQGGGTAINLPGGSGVYGTFNGSGVVSNFYTGVKGVSVPSTNAAYSSIGVYGQGGGGTGATAYGGYFTISSGSTSTIGAGLYASNNAIATSILQLQDNTTDVFTVADGGLVTISPVSAQTGSALTITQAGNPASGNALIKANNTNGTPSGNLLDLQANGSSKFSADTSGNTTQSGNISTAGQLIFSGTGNVAGTIRKNMIITSSSTVNDIVIIDTSNAGQVTTTTTANSNRVFGVASATNIAGTAQDIVTGGVFQIRITGDGVANNEVNVGDFITTSTTAGRGQVNNSAAAGTAIGRALSRDDAANLVWIYVSPGSGGAPTDLQQAYNLSTSSPEIVLNTTNNGITIQNASSPVTGNLFEVQSNGGATTYLGVSSSGISVAGVASASTSVQTPLLTTASGALTIETGSAAAINIGSASTPTTNAINLNVNTSVASTKTLTVLAGLTSLTANSAVNGDGLHVSNGTGSGNIAIFNDDGSAVFRIVDDGGTILSPLSSYTGSALTITQAGNPSTGNALIKANNTNGTPSGRLLDLQTNGTTQYTVDVSGNALSMGQLQFARTGNQAATIQKRMTVTSTITANDLVIIDTTLAGQVTTTISADSSQVFGIATTTNILPNTAQDIVTNGVYQINITPADGVAGNNVAVGDFITSSTTAGRGKVNNSAPAGTVIGRALSTDDVNNKVWIYVTPGAGGSPTNLQQAYNLSSNPEITVDATRGALSIQDASSAIGANLFEVQSNGGGTTYLGVTASGIAVTGTATVSTSLQTPLITTASGNLGLQPASGIVVLNKVSTANELRVYENAATPTNYISIKHGSVTASSGNITIDSGSSSTIHIGTSGAPVATAISLNVNTTVVSGQTLTVAGGLTSLTANGGSNGEGLNVSNSTGSGNIAVFKDGSGAGTNVVTIANSGYTTFKNVTDSSTALQIQNAIGSTALVIDTSPLNSLLSNSNFEDTNIATWTGKGSGTVARDTSVGPYIGLASLQVTAGTASGNGAKYDLGLSVATYSLSFSIRQLSGTALSASNFEAGWNNGSTDTACTLNPSLSSQAPVSGGWVRYTCTFTGSASGHIYWKLSSAVGTSAVFNIDAVQLQQTNAATAYKETGISLNGLINSTVRLQNANNSTTALQVQQADGTKVLSVDTLNRRVGIALSGDPTQALEVGGNILASGSITGSEFNFASGTTAQRRYSMTRTLPDTNNLYVEVGDFALSQGAHSLNVGIIVSQSGFSVSKTYTLNTSWGMTGGAWKDAMPTHDSGPWSGENFVLEVFQNTDTLGLRLRRIAGTVTGAVATINIQQNGSDSDAFTAKTGTGGSGSGNGIFKGTPMVQDGLNGRVGIQNAAPAYTLDVTGTINSSTTISASTSLQAPLLTTASGNLAVQSATGVLSLNTTGQTNEMRVYDSGPTNYTYMRNGTIATSTGALSIDTGNASALNIGSTNSNAINLGANTTIASTKSLTVTSGATILTANSAINGNGLQVSNSSGTGNIAIFNDDSTSVLTIADQGIVTIRNLSNSATGFQVQNASGHASLVLDTTNKHLRVYENSAGVPTKYADIYYDSASSTANYTASSGTVAVGTGAGAITITSGSGAGVNITGDAASLWRTATGSLTLQSGTSSDLIFSSGSSIVSVSGASVFKLGANAGNPGTCTAGAVVYNSSTSRLIGCEGSTWQNLTQNLQEAYNISSASTPEIKVDSTRGSFDIQDANTTIAGDLMTVRGLNAGGLGTVLLGVDSTGNTRMQNTSGTNLFKANATSSRVEIGSPSSHTSNPIILVLDNYNNATEPTGTNGAMYYNVISNKFRCYENSAWKDCLNGFNTVTKMTDQAAAQSSTAIQEDNTLRFSVAANTSYIFEAWIPIDSADATADLKYTFTTPGGATMQILTTRPSSGGSSTAAYNVCSITTSGNICTDTTVNSTANFIKVEGYLANGINAGTVVFQFAQNTSTAVSSPVVKAGATLSWHTTN